MPLNQEDHETALRELGHAASRLDQIESVVLLVMRTDGNTERTYIGNITCCLGMVEGIKDRLLRLLQESFVDREE